MFKYFIKVNNFKILKLFRSYYYYAKKNRIKCYAYYDGFCTKWML